MLQNKKAFEIQFNWIFVLVAGVAILLFFTFIIVKQKGISDVSIKTTVLKTIETIITGASVSTDTINIITIPNSDIEVGCNRVSIGGVSKQYQNLILFAPSSIKSNKLITQTIPFEIPYRAANLLYMTSPQIRYIIIGDTLLSREINKSLPSDLKKEFNPPITTITNEGDSKVRFLIFNNLDVNTALSNTIKKFKIQDSDVTAIKINGDLTKGEIEFYQRNGEILIKKGASHYLTKSSLLGAIYADTNETYECSMINVFYKLILINEIYGYKTQKLYDNAKLNQQKECEDSYTNALRQLRNIHDSANTKNFDLQNFNKISTAASSLSNENKNLQRYSCPPIY